MISDPLSYIGGLFDCLFLLGTLLVSSYSSFAYQAALLKRIFKRNSAADSVARAQVQRIAGGWGWFSEKDIHNLWERQLSRRKDVRISVLLFCCACLKRTRSDKYVMNTGNRKIMRSLDVANVVKCV